MFQNTEFSTGMVGVAGRGVTVIRVSDSHMLITTGVDTGIQKGGFGVGGRWQLLVVRFRY